MEENKKQTKINICLKCKSKYIKEEKNIIYIYNKNLFSIIKC